MSIWSSRLVWCTLAVVIAAGCAHGNGAQGAESTQDLAPRVIRLNSEDAYQRILKGPPDAVGMRSGRVVLSPSEGSESHSSKHYEEVIVVLSGSGELRAEGFDNLELAAGTVAYVPPQTVHEVICTGEEPLRYIYVAAPTQTVEKR